MPAMPPVNVEDSAQNAFVQSWLLAWAKAHTVYGSDDWESAARAKIAADPDHAKTWNRTVEREVADAQLFESTVELIQETYNHDDHQARDAGADDDGDEDTEGFLVTLDGMIESTEEFIADDGLRADDTRIHDLSALLRAREVFDAFYTDASG